MLQNEYLSTPIYKKIILLIFSFIVLSIQLLIFYFAFIGSLYNENNIFIQVLYYVGLALGIIVALLVLNFETNPSYKVTWVVLILILPLFFSYLYVLNYTARRLPKKKQKLMLKYVEDNKIKTDIDYDTLTANEKKIATLVYNEGYEAIYKNTKVIFYNDARLKHEALISYLKKATKYIFLEYFIISDGKLLDEIINILEDKGNEGVEIKFLYDDLGSKRTLSRKTLMRLINIKNLKLCVFQPLGFNLNPLLNYRDHRKIAIIDGKIAFCGGDNLADEYIHLKKRFGYWRDNACSYEGDAVLGFIGMFSVMWYTSCKERIELKDYYINHDIINDSYVLPISDGPHNDEQIAYDVFTQMINQASKTLYISTPYLIIDDAMLNSIIKAKKSGVDVKILTPGIPDKKLVFYITRAHYKTLLEAGIEIYEFSEGFNHAKNIIVDDNLAFNGTVNLDYRSMYLHYECGAVIFRDPVITQMNADFIETIKRSKLVTLKEFNNRNIFSKLAAFLLRIFSPLL